MINRYKVVDLFSGCGGMSLGFMNAGFSVEAAYMVPIRLFNEVLCIKFTEAHHLIPIQFQQKYWDELHINIDCLENIVSLYPNCHRAVHYGAFDEKNRILKSLFGKKIEKMRDIGIYLSEQQLIEMYV